jgi:hypothetical protein
MQDIHIHVTHHNFPARSKYVRVSRDEVGAFPRNGCSQLTADSGKQRIEHMQIHSQFVNDDE